MRHVLFLCCATQQIVINMEDIGITTCRQPQENVISAAANLLRKHRINCTVGNFVNQREVLRLNALLGDTKKGKQINFILLCFIGIIYCVAFVWFFDVSPGKFPSWPTIVLLVWVLGIFLLCLLLKRLFGPPKLSLMLNEFVGNLFRPLGTTKYQKINDEMIE